MHQYPIYLSSCGALEKLNHCTVHLAFQLEIKICQTQERLQERKREIFKQECIFSWFGRSPPLRICYHGRACLEFVKFTISGLDGVRAGRLWLKTKEGEHCYSKYKSRLLHFT